MNRKMLERAPGASAYLCKRVIAGHSWNIPNMRFLLLKEHKSRKGWMKAIIKTRIWAPAEIRWISHLEVMAL